MKPINEVPEEDEIKSLGEHNFNLIKKYIDYKKSISRTKFSPNTQRTIYQITKKFALFIDKPLDKATQQDGLDYFNPDNVKMKRTSRDSYIGHLKAFYKWLDKPDIILAKKRTRKEKREEKDIKAKDKYFITIMEYHKIINWRTDKFNQIPALWECLYKSGARPDEVLQMRLQDFYKDEHNRWTVDLIKSKTYPRNIPVEQPREMIRYINNHPKKNDKNAPLWFVLKSTITIKPLTYNDLEKRFRVMRKEIPLKETHTLKSFRKTRATILFNHPDSKVREHTPELMGWADELTALERRKEYDLTSFEELKTAICGETEIIKDYDELEKENIEFSQKLEKENEHLRLEIDDLRSKVENRDKRLKKKDEENEARFKKLEDEMRINLNPNTPQSKKLLLEFKKEIPEILEEFTGRKPTEEQTKEFTKFFDILLNKQIDYFNGKRLDEFIGQTESYELIEIFKKIDELEKKGLIRK